MHDYEIQILNSSLQVIGKVIDPLPLGASGNILEFSKELSDFGQCHFRVSSFDPILIQYGDIFQPHTNHVRILRHGVIVWHGAIIENAKRSSQYWDVLAAEYEFYLNKIMILRSSIDPNGGGADGVYRIFNSGTMAAAVTAMINESIATLNTPTNSASPLAGMTVGTIQNPNYPPNMTDAGGNLLTGAWNFIPYTTPNSGLQLTYDFQTVLYAIQQLGIYAYADFYLDSNLVFNFVTFKGNNLSGHVNFIFNVDPHKSNSNIIDYSIPRLGQRQTNDIIGVATDTNGSILHDEQTDQASITKYGLLQGVAAYTDIKDQGILDVRIQAELPLVSTLNSTNATVVLNQSSAFPLGQWDIGDIVTVQIYNNGVNFNKIMRVVGVSVAVGDTGRELTTCQLNTPLPWQLQAIGA